MYTIIGIIFIILTIMAFEILYFYKVFEYLNGIYVDETYIGIVSVINLAVGIACFVIGMIENSPSILFGTVSTLISCLVLFNIEKDNW